MSLKQVDLGRKLAFQEDPDTGESREDLPPVVSEEYEIQAEGPAACRALMGEMKDWAQVSLQQAYNREQKYGAGDLTDPNGRPVRILGNQEELYRARGYGQKTNRVSFRMNGFSGLRKEGIRKYKSGKNFREVWYKDGRYVKEEW